MEPTLNGKPLDDCTRDELRDALKEQFNKTARANVIVGTPSGGSSIDAFNDTLFRMTPYSAVNRVSVNPFRCTGSSIAHNQNEILAGARRHGASHLLFFENDESIDGQGDAIVRLLQHDKDIVGATYMFKTPGVDPCQIDICAMGVEISASGGAEKKIDFRSLYTRPELTKVAGLPIGLLLVKMHVFDKIEEMFPERPIFYHDVVAGSKLVRTTDYVFCHNARLAGFDVWLDAPLSLRIKHWGQFPYQFPAALPVDMGADFDAETYNNRLVK